MTAPTTKSKLLLIYNPNSGKQVVNRVLGEIVTRLQDVYDLTIRPTSYEGHAEDVAANEGSAYNVVVAAGGDGTIHEVVNGLMTLSKKPILGILPAGTANDIARTMGIPLDLHEACDFITRADAKLIDVGQYNDRYFINFLGLGLITTVSNEVKDDHKTMFAKLTYYLRTAQNLKNPDVFRVHIETQGDTVEADAVMVYVANGQSLAGVELFADNDVDTGTLEVIVVKNVGLSEMISAASSVLRKEDFDHEAFEVFTATKLRIECSPAQELDADGEKHGTTPVKISLLHDAIRVLRS